MIVMMMVGSVDDGSCGESNGDYHDGVFDNDGSFCDFGGDGVMMSMVILMCNNNI